MTPVFVINVTLFTIIVSLCTGWFAAKEWTRFQATKAARLARPAPMPEPARVLVDHSKDYERILRFLNVRGFAVLGARFSYAVEGEQTLCGKACTISYWRCIICTSNPERFFTCYVRLEPGTEIGTEAQMAELAEVSAVAPGQG